MCEGGGDEAGAVELDARKKESAFLDLGINTGLLSTCHSRLIRMSDRWEKLRRDFHLA